MMFPACPDLRVDCRFSEAGQSSTALDSPVQYDRAGTPVAGGLNTVAVELQCGACGRRWACSQTELAWTQGVDGPWELLP